MMNFIYFFLLLLPRSFTSHIKGMGNIQARFTNGFHVTDVLWMEGVSQSIPAKEKVTIRAKAAPFVPVDWKIRGKRQNLRSSSNGVVNPVKPAVKNFSIGSNNKIKPIYSQQKKYNTISAISVPHHIETNMGRWIHVTVVQAEEVYDPSNLNGQKITMTKEHSIYIYNPSLDQVVDLSKISLDQLIPHRKTPTLMRIHSLCRFGDSFGSLMCDCGPQLIAAKRAIISNGSGMIIYLEQEGRNAGLAAKAAAYRLDAVEKISTDKTFNELGLDRSDLRDYHVVLDIFSIFKINEAEILTNNPKKFALLTSSGKEIIQRPISIPATEYNLDYLTTKKKHMGHERLVADKKSSNENHIKIANILNEIPQVINEKNMSIFQKIVDEEKNNKLQANCF